MAALSGATGNIALAATELVAANVALITRWTASAERDIHDISNFGTQTNERTKLGGMMDLTVPEVFPDTLYDVFDPE